MVDTAVLYGADEMRAKEEMMDSLNFEIKLANISLPKEERRDATVLYNPMTLIELQQKYPYVDWLTYMNDILPKDVQITNGQMINVKVRSFFKKLGKLLRNTPKRIMANYVMWRITEDSSLYLTEDFQQRQAKYKMDVSGTQDVMPRWKECVDVVTNKLPMSMDGLFIRHYFREDTKNAALELVQNIKAVYEHLLQTVEWMDATTLEQALNKLEAMVLNIGYPDVLMDDKKLEEYYEGLEINSDYYLESILRINQFQDHKYFSKLKESVRRTDWTEHLHMAEVNAAYLFQNSMVLPAGILQDTLFLADRPNFVNYGAIGSLIGSIFTYGFGEQGHQFDENGNLGDWWDTDTKAAYSEKSRCLIDQYGNYTEQNDNWAFNDIKTLNTNIGDNGGVKQAYIAYKRWVAKHGEEQRLPGLDYTPDQLFWIAAAQNWCSVYRPETLKAFNTTSEQSPDQFRVLSTFSNMVDFSKSYNCPLGSNMNPVEKCEVW